MGYYVTFVESTAKFKISNQKKIIDALKAENKKVEEYYRLSSVLDSNNIKKIFDELDFEIEKSGKYYKLICYNSEKLGEQEIWFPIIAPYMEDGFIHMIGEEGNHWKWKFDHGRFREVAGRIMFDDEFHVDLDRK